MVVFEVGARKSSKIKFTHFRGWMSVKLPCRTWLLKLLSKYELRGLEKANLDHISKIEANPQCRACPDTSATFLLKLPAECSRNASRTKREETVASAGTLASTSGKLFTKQQLILAQARKTFKLSWFEVIDSNITRFVVSIWFQFPRSDRGGCWKWRGEVAIWHKGSTWQSADPIKEEMRNKRCKKGARIWSFLLCWRTNNDQVLSLALIPSETRIPLPTVQINSKGEDRPNCCFSTKMMVPKWSVCAQQLKCTNATRWIST